MYFKQIFTDILLGHLVKYIYIYIYIPITSTYHIKDFIRACAGIYLVLLINIWQVWTIVQDVDIRVIHTCNYNELVVSTSNIDWSDKIMSIVRKLFCQLGSKKYSTSTF